MLFCKLFVNQFSGEKMKKVLKGQVSARRSCSYSSFFLQGENTLIIIAGRIAGRQSDYCRIFQLGPTAEMPCTMLRHQSILPKSLYAIPQTWTRSRESHMTVN